jgi:hypothetical protein
MDPGRGRRERAPKRGAAALAELAALRRGGGGGDAAPKQRLDAFELKDEGAVYDVVDEDEYAELVAKRRREGGEDGERCVRGGAMKCRAAGAWSGAVRPRFEWVAARPRAGLEAMPRPPARSDGGAGAWNR